MKTIDRRIRTLEDRVWPGNGKPPLLLVVSMAGWGLALDQDRCIQIFRECGFLPTGPVGVNRASGSARPQLYAPR
jgi:hypothetical protein